MRFSLILCRILASVLILQVALPPMAFMPMARAADEKGPRSEADSLIDAIIRDGNQDPETARLRTVVETEIARIDEALDNGTAATSMPTGTRDTFRLIGQKLISLQNGVNVDYNVSTQLELPKLSMDFDTQVRVEFNPENRTLSLVAFRRTRDENGAQADLTIASRVFQNLDVVAVARDKEILHILTRDGSILAMDMVYARRASFLDPAPIPLFKVAKLSVDLTPEQLATVRLQNMARGVRPPDAVAEGATLPQNLQEQIEASQAPRFTMGSLMVTFDGENGRTLAGVYDRGVTQMQIYRGNMVIAFQAALASRNTSSGIAAAVTAASADPVVAATVRQENGNLDAATRDILVNIPEATIEQLSAAAKVHSGRGSAVRDELAITELRDELARLRARAQAERQSLAERHARQQARADGIADWITQKIGSRLPVPTSYDVNSPPLRVRARDLIDTVASRISSRPRESASYARGQELDRILGANDDYSGEWIAAAREVVSARHADQRSIFYRAMSSNAMKVLGAVTAVAAGFIGLETLAEMRVGPETARPLAWAVHAANHVYENYIPEVLTDKIYRVTLLKSTVALMMFVPIFHVVGIIYGRATGMLSQQAKAALGTKAWGFLTLPYWVRIARIFGRPNFVSALRLGLNPNMRVRADSATGRAVGLTSDIRVGDHDFGSGAGEEHFAQQRNVLNYLAQQKARVRGYSFALAMAVVAERYDVDPATLTLLKQGRVTEANVQELLSNPEFRNEWVQVSREYVNVLQTMRANESIPDLSQISPEQLAADYAELKTLAERIRTRGNIATAVERLRIGFGATRERLLRFLGTYGASESAFLSNVRPSKEVYEQSWEQFFADYLFMVVQVGIFPIGPHNRATLSEPQYLAADPNGPLWTNPAHLADASDQAIVAYGMSNPANLAQLYQRDTPPTEDRFNPIESYHHYNDKERLDSASIPRMDTFVPALMTYLKGVISLEEARYGYVIERGFLRRMRTLQASITTSLIQRTILGGQGVLTALGGYAMVLGLADVTMGWQWRVNGQGYGHYVHTIEANRENLNAALIRLGRGARVGNEQDVQTGYSQLTEIFLGATKKDLPDDLQMALSHAEEYLGVDPALRLQVNERIRPFMGALARLAQSLGTNDEQRISAAYGELLAMYTGRVEPKERERIEHLNALSFFEYARNNPPFSTEDNGLLKKGVNFFFSFTTTAMALPIFVLSYAQGISPTTLAITTSVGATFYGLTSFIQRKVLDPFFTRRGLVRNEDERRQWIANNPEVRSVEGLIPDFDTFRARHIANIANHYGITPTQVQQSLPPDFDGLLQRQYDTLVKQVGCADFLSNESESRMTRGERWDVLIGGMKMFGGVNRVFQQRLEAFRAFQALGGVK